MLDKKTIEQLYRRNYDKMLRTATVMLHDEEEAHDIVGDLFARLADGKLLVPHGKEDAFLLVCTRHACLDCIKHLSVKERMMRHLTLATPQTVLDDTNDTVEEMLHFALQTFTPQTYRVFLLRYGDQLSYKEIAAQLGISEVAVYKHLSQALTKLKQRFNPENQ